MTMVIFPLEKMGGWGNNNKVYTGTKGYRSFWSKYGSL